MFAPASIADFFLLYGLRICAALLILGIGIALAGWVGRLFATWLSRVEMEPPVRTLLVRLVKLLVLILTGILALDKFGIQIAPLIAGIGIAGLGIGLALQGVLGNLVAGLTIILTKPFRVGEYIEIHGVEGQVNVIELFSTTLTHPDLSRVIVPNRKIVGEILHNYGQVRQLSLKVPVSHSASLPQVIEIATNVCLANARVLKTPAPLVGVSLLDESSMVLTIQPWVNVPDYSAAQAELYRGLVAELQSRKIPMPARQREVRLIGNANPITGPGTVS